MHEEDLREELYQTTLKLRITDEVLKVTEQKLIRSEIDLMEYKRNIKIEKKRESLILAIYALAMAIGFNILVQAY